MPTTPNYNLPYPVLADPADVPTDMGELAIAVDNAILATAGGLPADTVVAAGVRIIANKLNAADAQPAWRVLGDGKQEWGAGGATAPDTNLYRSAASTLRTDGILSVGNEIRCGQDISSRYGAATQVHLAPVGANAGIYFGSALDTNLYRDQANSLATDDYLRVLYDGADLSALETGFVVSFKTLGARRIIAGGADSGGAGFRQLRIIN